MKISEISLDPISLNLDPNTEVEVYGSRARQKGTGYRDLLFRIIGTDDCLVLHKNWYNQYSGSFYDTAEVIRGFFAKQKSFGKECSKLSRKYGISWDLASALGGTEESVKFFLEDAPLGITYENLGLRKELRAGITRRKAAMKIILGYEGCKCWIDRLGQKHSRVIADYLLAELNKLVEPISISEYL